MFRESPSSVRQRAQEVRSPLGLWVNLFFLSGYFTLLPMLIVIALSWGAYAFTADNFYQESWMMPSLLIAGTFLAGAFMRQRIEDQNGRMGLFLLAMAALTLFSILTYYDIQRFGGVYSQYMPRFLPASMQDYLFMLPGVGLVGMLFFKYFTLKNYG